MRIDEALRTYLLTKTELTALITGSDDKVRIVPDDISDGIAIPAIIYFKVSDVLDHDLTGISELEQPVFQFSAYAPTKDGAKDIAEQIELALSDYSGTLSGLEIQWIRLMNRYSTKSVMADGTKSYVEDLEFEVNFVKE